MVDFKESIQSKNSSDFCKDNVNKYQKINIHEILKLLKKGFDSAAQAKRCFEKYHDTKGHKYYNMTEKEILESWNNKASASRVMGNKVDEYIQLLLEGQDRAIKLFKLDNDIENDPELKGKCKAIDDLLYNFKKLNLAYLIKEEPLYFIYKDKYIFSGREDCIFEGNNRLVLVDWKSSKVVTSNNFGEKMYGPMKNFDDCNYIEYTLQIYFYKYFLIHTYNIDIPIDPYIIEFRIKDPITKIGEYYVYKPAFEYDEELIEKIFEYIINKKEILS